MGPLTADDGAPAEGTKNRATYKQRSRARGRVSNRPLAQVSVVILNSKDEITFPTQQGLTTNAAELL